ncbi:uncharacterized membrane protein (UPF0127 family) [Luteimonas sp. 3794]|nr:uncharacterized membrane protein (UPF0127 family) [Luteimonas sp. 3794]
MTLAERLPKVGAVPPVGAAMRALRLLLLSVLASFLLPACASGGDWVELAGNRYTVEIAATDEARARGLMFRDVLKDGHGMLFIHDSEAPQAYWMKNTRIALDILYFDDARRLVSQQRDVPPCSGGNRCPSYPSEGPARYVLELNAGEAQRIGLKDGETLTLSPSIPVP